MSCESGSRILKRSIGTLQIEPPYLAKLEPEIPSFKLTNIQLRGYDLVVLERFGKYAKNVVEKMDLEVESFWATPKQSLSVKLMKPNSNIVKQTYDLSLYERNIQLVNLPSTKVPVLINVIESLLPPGVKLTIHEHQPEHLEIRYLPDLMLEELEEELQNIGKDR
ncbi:MRPL48 (predicted) [Pycnogonum litorale]